MTKKLRLLAAQSQLVYGLTGVDAAAALGLRPDELTRLLAEELKEDAISDDVIEAFCADYPVLHVLLPYAKGRAPIEFKQKDASALREMAEDGIKSARSLMALYSHRVNAARACFAEGARYDLDEDTGKPLLSVCVNTLNAAKAHYEALRDCPLVPQAFKQTYRLGIVYNKSAADLLIAAKDLDIRRDSPIVWRFKRIMNSALAVYFEGQASKKARQHDNEWELGEHMDKAQVSPAEVVQRTMILYSCAAFTELLIEAGVGCEEVVELTVSRLAGVFGSGRYQKKLIRIVFEELFWPHNRMHLKEVAEAF